MHNVLRQLAQWSSTHGGCNEQMEGCQLLMRPWHGCYTTDLHKGRSLKATMRAAKYQYQHQHPRQHVPALPLEQTLDRLFMRFI